LVLFTLGSLFALYEGAQSLLHPHTLTDPKWAIGIVLLGLVLEGFSLRMALREARVIKGDASWWGFIRNSRNPELPVVVLEDLGALLGLTIALAGISLAALTGDARFDALGSMAIGVLLGVIAVVLAIEMRSLERIRAAVLALESVNTIIHMRTQHIGPDELLVAAKVEFDADLFAHALADAIDDVEAAIREVLPYSAIIYIEPDFYEASQDSQLAQEPDDRESTT
ncbi:MAG: cation transporter, partial [Deltaproteobacteria bacterium]|nr:cation transporter [Deltaproteobacteria bacterium]